jgi:hypothetical protein
MADLSKPYLITQEKLHARYGEDKEKPGSPGRSLRSRGVVALSPGTGSETKQKPPSLPGQKLQAKRQLYEQELLTQLPSTTAAKCNANVASSSRHYYTTAFILM